MPVTTILPTKSVTLRYPPKSSVEDVEESYQLLELPAEIMKKVEQSEETFHLTIKGTPNDDAVLCTPTSTFLLRTISISNSLLICRAPSHPSLKRKRVEVGEGEEGRQELEIRGIEHVVLECVAQSPDLERIRDLLKDSAWRGLDSEGDLDDGVDVKVKRWTRSQLGSVVQASEGELELGLRERNVIEVDGYMLYLPSMQLSPLLSILLNLITIHQTSIDLSSKPPTATVPIKPILETVITDYNVRGQICSRLMGLFGDVRGDEWVVDLYRMVMEVGKGLIALLPSKGKSLDAFLVEWRGNVGEMWEDLVDIKMLEGLYLLRDPPISTITNPPKTITYFPIHSLPSHPPTRFADLFLTRPKWREEEMRPFLRGLTRDGDMKELDKLVAKFVRVVKEKDGNWWFPRRTG